MNAPDSASSGRLRLMAAPFSFCRPARAASSSTSAPITARTSAMTLLASGMARTNRPMLPNSSVAAIRFA